MHAHTHIWVRVRLEAHLVVLTKDAVQEVRSGVAIMPLLVRDAREGLREEDAVAEVATLDALEHRAVVCLLYTSPSPRDRTRSRMPSSA